MWTVKLINFGTNHSFETYEKAERFAKSAGFECAIYHGSFLFATWSPISGLKYNR